MTDDTYMSLGVALVRAMMRSAGTDRIRPSDWWARAKTALETGAAVAGSFSEMVSVMGRKLQIDVATNTTAEALADIAAAVGPDFEPFRRLCEEQALYVVALAQAQREQERTAQQMAFAEVEG